MKKVTMVVLLSLLVLAHCLDSAYSSPAKAERFDRKPLRITIVGAATSGVWFMVLNGVTECINKSYPGSNITLVPGTGLANIQRIHNNLGDCSFSYNSVIVTAAAGKDPFTEKLDNMATVATMYPSYYQIAVSKKLGIRSLGEIFTKKMKIKLSVGQIGSMADLITKQVFAEFGVTYEEFDKWGGKILHKSMADGQSMLAEGYIDGLILSSLYPTPTLEEAGAVKDLMMLPLSSGMINNLYRKYGYGKGVIPAKTYKFNAKDIHTITSDTVIIVPKDAPEEVSYKIARSIVENLDYLRNVHVALKDLTPKRMTQNLGLPLHKGAQMYYKEIGVIK